MGCKYEENYDEEKEIYELLDICWSGSIGSFSNILAEDKQHNTGHIYSA